MPTEIRVVNVLDCAPYTMNGVYAEHAYKGLHCYIDSLVNYKSWIDKQGNESAIRNIETEIAHLRTVCLHMYEAVIAPAQIKARIPVEVDVPVPVRVDGQ